MGSLRRVEEEGSSGRNEEERRKREKKKKEKREKGLKEKEGTPFGRWKDVFAKLEKQKRVAARCRGWERKNTRGNPRV